MLVYDKNELKSQLSTEQIFSLLEEFGGEPNYENDYIISKTICHNESGEGSRKLYYYFNSQLFQCYSNCNSFDVFELVIKVMRIQAKKEFDLNDAVRWIAYHFGLSGRIEENETSVLEDWKCLSNYERIQEIDIKTNEISLKEYDNNILKRFNYTVKIMPWLKENIKQEIIERNIIGFYPGGDQITIPHFDINGKLIGIRGRTLCQEDGEKYGKYRPLKVNKILYNHPLGFNLYNLNNSKDNIKIMKKAVVFESEKSALKMQSYFGYEGDISVATCGSNLTYHQVKLLLDLGVEEIILAFDKQYEALNTEESKKWINKLTQIHNKYKNNVLISIMWDKNNLLNYKDAPIDQTPEKFLTLFKERIIL